LTGCGAKDVAQDPIPIAQAPPQTQAVPASPDSADTLAEPKTADLFEAAKLGNNNDVKFYLRKDPEALNRSDANGMFPIHLAAIAGHSKVLTTLLQAGADANAQHTRVQATPLQYAATGGHVDAARVLLDAKANVNATDIDGRTPLMWAATSGQAQVAKLLLEHGADANQTNEAGMSPIHLAANKGHAQVLKVLLQAGADVNSPHPGNQATPLQDAAMGGYVEAARVLIDAKANLNATDSTGRTPLMWAATKGQASIVKLLLERGAAANQNPWRMDCP
jgi:ankyrin repeat protein